MSINDESNLLPLVEDVIDEEAKRLLESYELFKDSVEEDGSDILNIFELLQAKCPQKVTELWHDQVKRHFARIVRGGEDMVTGYDYRFNIVEYWFSHLAGNENDFIKLAPALLRDDLILPTLYKYCDLDQFPDEFLGKLLVYEQYDKVDQYLALIRQNRAYQPPIRGTVPLSEVISSIDWPLTLELEAIEDYDYPERREKKLRQIKEKVERIKLYLQKKIDEETDPKVKAKENIALTGMIKSVSKQIANEEGY